MMIGMLTDMYKPYISGVTHHVSLTKRALDAEGHKVFVFTFGGQDYVDEELYVIRSPAVPLADTGYNLSFRYNRSAQHKLGSSLARNTISMNIIIAQCPGVST